MYVRIYKLNMICREMDELKQKEQDLTVSMKVLQEKLANEEAEKKR